MGSLKTKNVRKPMPLLNPWNGKHCLCRTCVAAAQRDPPLQKKPVSGFILPSKPAKTFPAEQTSCGNMKLMQLPDEFRVLSSILAALPWKAKVNAACTCKMLNAQDPLPGALGHLNVRPKFGVRPRLEDGPEQSWCGMCGIAMLNKTKAG